MDRDTSRSYVRETYGTTAPVVHQCAENCLTLEKHCHVVCPYAIVPSNDERSPEVLAFCQGDIVWPQTCMRL